MKSWITAIGICIVGLAPVRANAAVYTWGGGTSGDWKVGPNWPGVAGYPGQNQAGDTATFAEETRANPTTPAFLASSLSFSVASVTLDATHANVSDDLEFQIQSSGNLAVSSTTLIKGDTNTTDAFTATVQLLSGGTLDPGALQIYGGGAGAGEAFFEFYSGGTLTNPDSLTMQGLSNFYAEADVTVTGSFIVDADSAATDAVVEMVDSGDDLIVDTITVGDASQDTKLTFTGAGSLQTN